MWLKNPTPLVTEKIVQCYQKGGLEPSSIKILSLGSGCTVEHGFDPSRTLDFKVPSIPKKSGKIHFQDITDAMFQANSVGSHALMRSFFSFKGGDKNYYRVNVPLTQEIKYHDIARRSINSLGIFSGVKCKKDKSSKKIFFESPLAEDLAHLEELSSFAQSTFDVVREKLDSEY